MSSGRLFLFGAPRLEHDEQSAPLRRTKALALLAYLALTRQPQHRDALLALLWPEFDTASARNNLRRDLSLLKAAVGEVLVADRLQVARNSQVDLWLDVAVFQEQVARVRRHDHEPGELCGACSEALTTAAALYTDDFMAGFSLPDSPAFDEWQFFQREELRQQLAAALQALIAWYASAGAYDTALAYARRWLQLDTLHEPAHRELMRLYAWSGQQAAALRQYDECARILDRELGAEPDAETTALYATVKTRRVTLPAQSMDAAGRATNTLAPHDNLPRPPTPFLGREQEIATIEQLLVDQHARLITISGPGGIGKTRLAIEIARRRHSGMADGVVFVALQSISSADVLVPAIADALACPLSGAESPRSQLLAYLGDKRLLLLLDNFEHLLGLEGAPVDLLGEILTAAPGVILLVTSRETLNLQEEWLLPLHGLQIPLDGTDDPLEGYEAVQFFVDRARRLRPDFSLRAEQEGVIRICRMVAGMPLALELAAAWTKTLPCDAIAAQIERSLLFADTRLRNVPERHRSLRAVFDYSWALLTPEEQAGFTRLSVFRGGFPAEAAAQVAGVTLPTLAALVDKSLLQAEGSGRYRMHELLRQYAAERLRETPMEAVRVRAAHAAYYLDFLARRTEAVISGRHSTAADEIAAELEDVHPAWLWAIESIDVEGICKAMDALGYVYQYRGRYPQAIAAAEQAVGSLRRAEPTRRRDIAMAHALNGLGWVQIRIGQMAPARQLFAESQAIFERLGAPALPGRGTDPLAGLANLALIEGNYAEAVRLGEEAVRRNQADGHIQNVAFAWYILAHTALAQGLYDRARYAAEQAYASVRAAQDRWFMAYVLNQLGDVAVAQGRYPEARQQYRRSYALREEFTDPEGMALALSMQGKVALVQGAYEEAQELYARSLTIYRSTADRGGVASALHGLGRVAGALGDPGTGMRYVREALSIAQHIHFVALMLALLTSAGELLLRAGHPARAAALLMLALRHPTSDGETGERAQQLLVRYERELAPNMDAVAAQAAVHADLDATVSRLLIELDESDAVS